MSYLRENVSDGELVNFYRKYVVLKDKLDALYKALDGYKSEVLDKENVVNKTVFLKQSMYKLAFKAVVEAHEELVNLNTYDSNYEYTDAVDMYI